MKDPLQQATTCFKVLIKTQEFSSNRKLFYVKCGHQNENSKNTNIHTLKQLQKQLSVGFDQCCH